jgi:acetoin:2,6-dichlorophenolindophenol oxidoreductase subunit alpha
MQPDDAARICDDTTAQLIFERMLTMRHLEEAVIRLSTEGRFGGHYHVYIGQEATGAAVLQVLGAEDLIATTHRNHGHVVGRGADPGRILAEILGRATGLNGGRSGTLHVCDAARGFVSTSATVGGCPALATGAAYAVKSSRQPRVSVAFFGDGALEEGIVTESFNIAALWKLPVLYVCENNSGGAWGPQKGGYPTAISAAPQFCQLPRAFGISATVVDGSDFEAVYAAAAEAVLACRSGQGPVFLEAVTERWPGSNPLWPELATTTDLMAAWERPRLAGPHADWLEQHDPLLKAAARLLDRGALSRDALLALDARVRCTIAEAVRFALESPFPGAESALSGVFAERQGDQR